MPPNRKKTPRMLGIQPLDQGPDEAPVHKIGYARVSMADQSPRMQIDALILAGVDERDIFHEQATGGHTNRPQFQAMMKDVRKGDVVYVWKLDRLARTAIDLYRIVQAIQDKGAHLKVITQPGLDTTNAAGRAMFGMLAVFAEFERSIILERTMAGLKAAKAKGRVGGSKPKHSDDAVLAAAKLGMQKGAKKLGMSLSGFIKSVNRVRAKLEANKG